jgi:hypothetical protein
MFKIDNLKIRFMRLSDGDTMCEIWMIGDGSYETSPPKAPDYTGQVRLHPNDRPDKITGKKLALLRAMLVFPGVYKPRFKAKVYRARIWEAFWAWVDSWTDCCATCGSKELRDSICVPCAVKDRREALFQRSCQTLRTSIDEENNEG